MMPHSVDRDSSNRVLAILLWSLLNHIEYLSVSDDIHITPSQIAGYLQDAVQMEYLIYKADGTSLVTKEGVAFVTLQLQHSGKWPRLQQQFRRKPISLDKVVFPKYYKTLKAASERSKGRT